MFGNNASGLLGISKTDDIQKYPQRVLAGKSKSTTMYLENIVSIAAGAHHMLALIRMAVYGHGAITVTVRWVITVQLM